VAARTTTMDSLSFMDRLILRIKRADTPFTRFARNALRKVLNPKAPPIPRFLKPVLRAAYEGRILAIVFGRALITIFYRHPLFQARCASIGRGVIIEGLPFVSGHVQLHIGNGVWIGGGVAILSGRIFDEPKLIMKDRSGVGWNTIITVNREVVLEEDVIVSYDCRITDTDGHSREADLRAAGVPPDPRDIRPVRICRNAWIGNGAHIMKGVTIGEGAIIGANSVVITNIPPYALAMGNPAEVLIRNYGMPAEMKRKLREARAAARQAQSAEKPQ